MNTDFKPARLFMKCRMIATLAGLVCGLSCIARAVDVNPLSPLDTSSPRATLSGFIETVDEIYVGMADILEDYAKSGQLYLSPELRQRQIALLHNAPNASRVLDLSDVSPVLLDSVLIERLVQLKEILDRIELPALADIPDAEGMARITPKRWRLPGTEIDFVQIREGPRAGDYLVSAATVARLPEFYDKVAKLPYKPGPAKQLNDAFRALSSGKTDTIYQAFLGSPIGLVGFIPLSWMLNMPGWANVPVAGLSAWQWAGLSTGLLVGALVIVASHRLGRRFVGRGEDDPGPRWNAIPVPLAIILVAVFLMPLLYVVFHIGGMTRVVLAIAQTMAFYLSAAWLSFVVLIVVGDKLVSSEHLKRSSLDSQLIRLSVRLIGVIFFVVFMIRCADELGFPAYSVLAGLGVGGLAVALAARDSIANLLGSLLILLEKPFRVGHVIRVAGNEGTVEDVGFRSTRIRTPDNSLVSIPNNAVVNATVENLSLRAMRRQRFFLQVTYDTPREMVEKLVAGVRRLILDHPLTNKSNFQVRFNNFSESSLDILVIFYLDVQDYSLELSEREAILLQTMDLVNEFGIEFAFPTRTLQIEAAPRETRAAKAALSSMPFCEPGVDR